MKDKLIRFMYGRYGVDAFSRTMVTAGLVLAVITLFVDSFMLTFIAWGVILYAYYRILSKNHTKRYAENQWFLSKTSRLRANIAQWKQRVGTKQTHRVFTCPSCKQKIRIPKGKGKIEIRCPKCGTTFLKRS